MAVRTFTDEDVDLVGASVPARAIGSVHRERLEQQSAGTCKYLLAMEHDRPAGWVVVRTGETTRSAWQMRFDCAEIEDLYVSPPARRRGLGLELMLAAEETARRLGFTSIGLATGGPSDPDYAAARRLYERLAYVDVAAGPWLVGWVWTNDRGERAANHLILESFFVKDLPDQPEDLRSRRERGDVPASVQAVLLPRRWDLGRLLALDLPRTTVATADYEWMLDIPMWRDERGTWFTITPNQVRADRGSNPWQWDRTLRANLEIPIHIAQREGRSVIIDGVHRLLKATMIGRGRLPARIVKADDWPAFEDPPPRPETDPSS
jgi:GNAT superfamily N-acetyltransferase